MHYIYKITNLINNKIYIGQSKDTDKRWKQHQYLANSVKKHQYIHRAMAKDGISNFNLEILDIGLNQWHADCLEINYINQYDSRNPDKGYNFSIGGYVTERSEETRKKISAALQGRIVVHSNQTKSKISKSHIGMLATPEQKIKQSLAKLGKPALHRHKFDTSTEQQIVELYKSGLNTADIGKQFNTRVNTICNILQRYSVEMRTADGGKKLKGIPRSQELKDKLSQHPSNQGKRKLTPEQEQQIIQLHIEGLGCIRIGKQLGLGETLVYRTLTRHNRFNKE